MDQVTATTAKTTTPAAVSTVEQLTSGGMTDTTFGNGTTKMLVSADGTNIYANAVGDPSKQAIVFIHGFVSNFKSFDDIFEDAEWRKRFYLVRYDVRGHGKSGGPEADEGWEWKRFAEDFDTVVEAFGVRRPFVAGWSLGASHLMDILSLHPVDYVAGLINIAGLPFIVDKQMDTLASAKAVDNINRMALSPTVEEFQLGVQEFIGACCRTLTDEVRERCLGGIMAMSRRNMVRSLTRKQRVETFAEAGKTTLPYLLIYGDSDELICAEELPKPYKAWRNFTAEVVEGGSHVPWSKTQPRDAAVTFREKTMGWIDSVMRSWN